MGIRRKAYDVWSDQLNRFERQIDSYETGLLQAWDKGDSVQALRFESRIATLNAGREAVYFSMESATTLK